MVLQFQQAACSQETYYSTEAEAESTTLLSTLVEDRLYMQVTLLHIQKEELKSPAPSTELRFVQEESLDNKAVKYKKIHRQGIGSADFFWLFFKYGGKFKIVIKIRCVKKHLIFFKSLSSLG